MLAAAKKRYPASSSRLDEAGAVNAVDDDAMVKDLAKFFQVSRYATRLRLANVYRRYAPF